MMMVSEADDAEPDSNQVEDPTYEPLIYRLSRIPHYYGDVVRLLFLLAAVFMLVGAPFYAQDLRADMPYIVIGTVALVCFAALTTPWKQSIAWLDSFIAGLGFIVFEIWALRDFSSTTEIASILRQVLAIVFLFAFYYSMKTCRAMLLHQIGGLVGSGYRKPKEEATEDEKREQKTVDDQAKEHDKAQRQIDEFLD